MTDYLIGKWVYTGTKHHWFAMEHGDAFEVMSPAPGVGRYFVRADGRDFTQMEEMDAKWRIFDTKEQACELRDAQSEVCRRYNTEMSEEWKKRHEKEEADKANRWNWLARIR